MLCTCWSRERERGSEGGSEGESSKVESLFSLSAGKCEALHASVSAQRQELRKEFDLEMEERDRSIMSLPHSVCPGNFSTNSPLLNL